MTKLAEKIDAPVITTVMGRGAISTEHPLYIGNIGMHGSYAANKTADECDLLPHRLKTSAFSLLLTD